MKIKVYDSPDGIGRQKYFACGFWENDVYEAYRHNAAWISKDHSLDRGRDNLNQRSKDFADEVVQLPAVTSVDFTAWLTITVNAKDKQAWESGELEAAIRQLLAKHYHHEGTRWVTYPWMT